MKYDYVEYFSEENHIPNTTKVRLIMLKIMKFLINYWSIVGCNNIWRCYHIYKRNISESESVEHTRLNSTSENVDLENSIDEPNNNISFDSEGFNSEDDVKYNDVTTEGKYNNINYNDLSKQLTLEELHIVLDNLEKRPSKEDFYNIWDHVLGITKKGFDDMLKELALYIEHYLLKYEYQSYHFFRVGNLYV
ncbi:hypothetical protein PFAG_02231 [Plasmodium falciparum Santa Lucia]|uniref:Plasmodium RESA N-terminal domain-containing protein n=1 Tax=Plasmodium falciparum Santa Lucia TaxID=478859 RepID=W7FX98_PLAFA|nr:hypothetical protein PFAG_02231 [Plasmodium falciparum Santa Lucia]